MNDTERLTKALEAMNDRLKGLTGALNANTAAMGELADATSGAYLEGEPEETDTADDRTGTVLNSQLGPVKKLEKHFDRLGVAVEVERQRDTLYLRPQEYLNGGRFQSLFTKPKAVEYDSDASDGYQNTLAKNKVDEYIRQTRNVL